MKRWSLVPLLVLLPAIYLAASEGDSAKFSCGPKLVWHPDGCADPPRKRKTPGPVYPRKARAAHAEACVVLLVRVSKDGTAKVERVLKSTNPGWGFEEAAQKAANKWRYKPAKLNGEPVEVKWPVFIDFLIDPPRICDTITKLDGYP